MRKEKSESKKYKKPPLMDCFNKVEERQKRNPKMKLNKEIKQD